MLAGWGLDELKGCTKLSRVQQRSAAAIVESAVQNAGQSFSGAVGHAGRQAAWRIARKPSMRPDEILEGHYEQTAARCAAYECVLLVEDTTALDYASHKALAGLGPISSSEHSKGILAHSCIAVTLEGVPLGFLSEQMWTRDPQERSKAKERRSKQPEDKESHKWTAGMQQAQSRLPSGVTGIVVADREADCFDFLAARRNPNLHLVVRASSARNVSLPDQLGVCVGSLFEAMAAAPVVGAKEVLVHRQGVKPERVARLEVRMRPLLLAEPQNGKRARDLTPGPVRVTVVQVTEVDAPDWTEPIEWTLLTTLECDTAERASQIADMYARRWVIERLHYVLKSGMRVERLQVDELRALQNTIAFLMISAWRVLYLVILSRDDPEAAATTVLSETQIQVLGAVTRREVQTVKQAVIAIAVLAGYEPYRSAPPPGPKRLWEGLRRLDDLTAGFHLARGQPQDRSETR